MNIDHVYIFSMFMFTNTLSQLINLSIEKSAVDEESNENNDSEDQGGSQFHVNPDTYEPSISDEQQMLQTDEVEIPGYERFSEDEEDQVSLRRQSQHRAREFPKKREFLQCRDEEPIVTICFNSCYNVFKSICTGFTCPKRLLVKTERDCHENCKKSYKILRGMKYVPPEKY